MAFWLGKDVTGKAVLADLVKMVHLLIAGTTGSGKSGCLNALISSILLRATPDEVRMIMIDPKKVELSNFNGVPHLLAPVVTNMKQATYVLDNITREMDRRYDVLSRNGCQDIRALNKKLARSGEEHMPYIMVIVDELADLMMVAPSEVEDSIIRLGQLGRSCGIHLVVATQRPSVDVVTGMIKTNIPSRIAFAVSSQTDSRIILDQGGAESLLGMGDMLFSPMGSNRLLRVQGALITAHEMKLLTEHWKRQAKPEFQEDLLENPAGPDADQQAQAAGGDELPRRGHQDRRDAPAPPPWHCCSVACASATRAPAGSSTSWRRWASSRATTAARRAPCSSTKPSCPATLARVTGEEAPERASRGGRAGRRGGLTAAPPPAAADLSSPRPAY